MSLLSGGEQALTSMALIFSILRSRRMSKQRGGRLDRGDACVRETPARRVESPRARARPPRGPCDLNQPPRGRGAHRHRRAAQTLLAALRVGLPAHARGARGVLPGAPLPGRL